jgi:3-oxoacyl-[acyl-carrier-protein] synthase II
VTATRIVITGMGVFCGAAQSIPDFRTAVLQGKSGVGPVDLFDVADFPSKIAVQVKGYDPAAHFTRRQVTRLSRTDQFALLAAQEALTMSGLAGCYDPYDIGVCVGGGAAGMFQAEQWLAADLRGERSRPAQLRGVLPDKTCTELALAYRLAGYQGSITTACSSSASAIGWGADLIRSGRQKAMLCGGADSLALLTFAGFNSLKVMDPEPCAPFSLGRQGITLGEGAAFVVLEEEQAARARGADIIGYLLGYALVGEAHHMTAPEPSGESAARVMTAALAAAGLDTGRVGWVNAHGTGTPANDVVESNAMKQVFGERVQQVPLVSTKPITGHCLGAAGSVEAVATLLALNAKTIPRTLHFRGRDPECDLDYCHDASKPSDCSIALSNSFAFGGNITSLALAAADLQQGGA